MTGRSEAPADAGVPQPGAVLVGAFRLSRVNGRALPALWRDSASGGIGRVRSTWDAGEVRFHADGTFVFRATLGVEMSTGGRTEQIQEIAGRWALVAPDEIRIWSGTGTGSVTWHRERSTSLSATAIYPDPDGGTMPLTLDFIRTERP